VDIGIHNSLYIFVGVRGHLLFWDLSTIHGLGSASTNTYVLVVTDRAMAVGIKRDGKIE